MPFGPDSRPDLSGVPADFQPVRQGRATRPLYQRSQVWLLVRVAAWLCLVLAVGLGLAFLGFNHALLFPDEPTAKERAAEVIQAEREQHDRNAQETYRSALQDAARASAQAERQHEQAMKAVQAARDLARNPDSGEARQRLDRAMQDMAKSADTALPADRSQWKAEDYARALREGRSLTQ